MEDNGLKKYTMYKTKYRDNGACEVVATGNTRDEVMTALYAQDKVELDAVTGNSWDSLTQYGVYYYIGCSQVK